jgi:hypothetical protein
MHSREAVQVITETRRRRLARMLAVENGVRTMPRYPMTEEQAYVLTRVINKKRLAKRDTNPVDVVILTQVGALKVIDGKLQVTHSGKLRFIKWARKQGMV